MFVKLQHTRVIESNDKDYNYFLDFKPRQINPYILTRDKLTKLSLVSKRAKEKLEDMTKRQQTGVYIKEINDNDKLGYLKVQEIKWALEISKKLKKENTW